jgi:hypothetical protein
MEGKTKILGAAADLRRDELGVKQKRLNNLYEVETMG